MRFSNLLGKKPEKPVLSKKDPYLAMHFYGIRIGFYVSCPDCDGHGTTFGTKWSEDGAGYSFGYLECPICKGFGHLDILDLDIEKDDWRKPSLFWYFMAGLGVLYAARIVVVEPLVSRFLLEPLTKFLKPSNTDWFSYMTIREARTGG